MDKINLPAYAKINIGLNIISDRSDGYHNIETVLQQIDLCDQIGIKKSKNSEIIIRSDSANIPLGEKNICYKAAMLVRQLVEKKDGIAIEIEKRIPVGSGLGGGSSDAAAILMGLNQLWQLGLSRDDLHLLALKLGADVPFFLHGGTALATGIGEILITFELPFSFYSVLIYPNIEISSTWAYKNFNFSLTKTKKSIKLSHIFLNQKAFSDLQNVLSNDLEEVVFQKYPILRDIKQMLYRQGALFACMSGSGSTIYGLFENYLDAVVVMRSNLKPYQIILAKPMITKNHLSII
jgi:4-diphosphocytidyl-2-C-methyl-D-erythritol kinase